ncbi:hypothetical protein D6833_11675 [Candidatus Parcubacteria bacterium]|nr:MAG: hypothetical protein D6833_11675 [Candidatus Parcubacteria bacterium]
MAADATIQGLEDLAGRCVAVEWGSGGDAVARRLLRQMETPTFRVETFPTPEEALDALRSGQCAGVLMDGVSLRLAQAQGAAIRLLEPPLESEPYVIVMARQAYTLQANVNQALDLFAKNGALDELEDRWLGNP